MKELSPEIRAYIYGVIDAKLHNIDTRKPMLISRKEVMKEIGRANYEDAIRTGRLTPIKGKGTNSLVRFRYREFEEYIEALSLE